MEETYRFPIAEEDQLAPGTMQERVSNVLVDGPSENREI